MSASPPRLPELFSTRNSRVIPGLGVPNGGFRRWGEDSLLRPGIPPPRCRVSKKRSTRHRVDESGAFFGQSRPGLSVRRMLLVHLLPAPFNARTVRTSDWQQVDCSATQIGQTKGRHPMPGENQRQVHHRTCEGDKQVLIRGSWIPHCEHPFPPQSNLLDSYAQGQCSSDMSGLMKHHRHQAKPHALKNREEPAQIEKWHDVAFHLRRWMDPYPGNKGKTAMRALAAARCPRHRF